MADGIIGATRAAQLIPSLDVYNEAPDLVVLSSDWDADILSPLVKIKTVLTRPDGRSFPDVATVIPLMTRNPAKLLKTSTGSIEVGKLADIVALDKDIFNIPVESIDEANVVFTMMNEKVVFDPSGIAGTPVGTITPSPAPDSSSFSILYRFGFLTTIFVVTVLF
jgi:predicted amidohydrolase YtcJ